MSVAQPTAARVSVHALTISERGKAFIKRHEGLRLRAYKDDGGHWTIGYGHTTATYPGDTCTQRQADDWFERDLGPAIAGIGRAVQVPLHQYEYDTLCSLIFNIGIGAFERSDVLRDLNRAQYESVPSALWGWRYVNHKEDRGLMRRRSDEIAMWKGNYRDNSGA